MAMAIAAYRRSSWSSRMLRCRAYFMRRSCRGLRRGHGGPGSYHAPCFGEGCCGVPPGADRSTLGISSSRGHDDDECPPPHTHPPGAGAEGEHRRAPPGAKSTSRSCTASLAAGGGNRPPAGVIPEIENAWRAEGAPRAERPSGIFRRVAGPASKRRATRRLTMWRPRPPSSS
jgi:hypothetical protein